MVFDDELLRTLVRHEVECRAKCLSNLRKAVSWFAAFTRYVDSADDSQGQPDQGTRTYLQLESSVQPHHSAVFHNLLGSAKGILVLITAGDWIALASGRVFGNLLGDHHGTFRQLERAFDRSAADS